jgi:hypothetical protein
MANPKIEVEIGAVIDGLRKGFGDSVRIIETLEKQALELDKALKAATDLPEIQSLNSRLAQTKAALTQLKTSGVEPLTKATSGYNAVGTDFARIIQDAPFGIIGVGNNIQQLAGSFQQLKNSTGSTGGAVKAALASILSPANAVVLGISILTSALTVLQMQGFFKTEEAAKSLAEQLDKYKDTLGETTQAQLEGAASADKEIIKIQSLRAVIENETVSREKRLAAVQKLRAEAPSIFKNLSDEQILAGKVGDSYNRLTQILVARATASSGINKIVALADEERLILEKNAEILQQISAFEQKAAKFRAQGQQELVLINENQIRYLKQQNPEIQRLADIEAERVKLTGLVNQNLIASVDYNDKSATSSSKINDESKKLVRTYEDLSKIDPFITFASLEREGSFFEDVEKQLISIESGVARTRGIYQQNINGITQSNQALVNSLNGSGIGIEQFYAAIANGAAEGFTSLDSFIGRLSETQAFINQTFEILKQGAANTLGDVAFSIGDALASGGNVIKAAGGALLGGIAGILNQLGQLAIATGLAVEGIKKALTTLNPAVAIAAGIALVALAGFVSNKAKSLGGSKGGGGGGGSSVGGSGVGGGTAFTGGAQGGMFAQNRDVSGEFVVRGTDLVYVLGQANNKINKG